MLRIPVSFDAEYRGVAPGGEFTNDGGELIAYGEKLRFEVELPNGDVQLVPVSVKALDQCSPPVDAKKLQRGDRVTFRGVVGGADAYFRPHSAVPVGAAVKLAS